jgi:hypothetical protein
MYKIWNPKEYYPERRPLGSWNNPYDEDPEKNSYNAPHYLKPENVGQNYIALYLGFTKRFVTQDIYTSEKYAKEHPECNRKHRDIYYCIDFIYKKSHEAFGWNKWHDHFDSMAPILRKLRAEGHLDIELINAWITLDEEVLYAALINKLKQIMPEPDLSLDWRKGTKYEGK